MTLEADDEPTLESFMSQARDAWLNEVHTSFTARVESYDRASQTATLKPMVRRSIPNADGGRTIETLPILRAVRVAWLRAGAAFVHMPLRAGHFVQVHCSERDFTRWAQTGEEGDPIDVRTHSLSFAWCVPGLYPKTQNLGDAPDDAIVIGWDGGATVRIAEDGTSIKVGTNAEHFVALANLVKARLDAIQTAFDAHTHFYVPGTLPPASTAPPDAPIGTLADVAASIARAE